MSTLIYIPAGLQTPELEILIAKVQNSIDAGENTIVATCAGGKGYACSFNIYSSRGICSGCKSRTREGLALLKGKWIHVTTPATIEPRLNRIKGYRHLSQLQAACTITITSCSWNVSPT